MLHSEEKMKTPSVLEPVVKTVIAERDNFNKDSYQNLTWVSSSEMIVQQSETVTSNVLTFMVPKAPAGDYYDLTSLRMKTRMTLTDKDGAVPTPKMVVGPINYFCQTMIKSVEIFVNGTQVVTSTPYYAQKAMVDALINHSEEDRQGILTNQGFYMDEPEHLMGAASFEKNDALVQRAGFFGSYDKSDKNFTFSKDEVGFFTPLLTDINKIDLPLVSKVDLKIIITFHPANHYMWTAAGASGENLKCKLNIKHAELRVKQLRSADGYTRSLEDRLEKHPLKYHFKRIEPILETWTMPSQVFTKALTLTSNLPERILIMIQPQSYLNSSYTVNPVNWSAKYKSGILSSTLSDVELTINGNPVMKTKVDKFPALASLHYQELMELTGNDVFGCGLKRRYFGSGSYLILFDLTKSGRCSTSGNVRQPSKEGQAVLTMKAKDSLPCSLAVLLLQEYNSSFTVDKNRKVVFNYLD